MYNTQKIFGFKSDMKPTLFIFTFCLVLISFSYIFSQDCGKERWQVKSLSDPDTVFINFQDVINSSISEQINMPAPDGRQSIRLASETSLYFIEAYILGFAEEKDRDIHIIVADINTDETMVVEIVNPICSDVKATSREAIFKDLYNWFVTNIGTPKHKFHYLEECIYVNIVGIGFWDYIHGQKGMAGNGRELHPVLFISKR